LVVEFGFDYGHGFYNVWRLTLQADQLVLGLSSISLPLVDHRALDCLTSFYGLLSALLGDGGDGELATDDAGGQQQSTSLALVTDLSVTCGGVKLASLSLPSISVVINSIQVASGGELVEHVLNCAFRTLPSVAASLALDFLKGLAVKIV
jgi:hypothetical protein